MIPKGLRSVGGFDVVGIPEDSASVLNSILLENLFAGRLLSKNLSENISLTVSLILTWELMSNKAPRRWE